MIDPLKELSDVIGVRLSMLEGRIGDALVRKRYVVLIAEVLEARTWRPRKGGDVVAYDPQSYARVAEILRDRDIVSYGDCAFADLRAFWVKAGDDIYLFPGAGRLDAMPASPDVFREEDTSLADI